MATSIASTDAGDVSSANVSCVIQTAQRRMLRKVRLESLQDKEPYRGCRGIITRNY